MSMNQQLNDLHFERHVMPNVKFNIAKIEEIFARIREINLASLDNLEKRKEMYGYVVELYIRISGLQKQLAELTGAARPLGGDSRLKVIKMRLDFLIAEGDANPIGTFLQNLQQQIANIQDQAASPRLKLDSISGLCAEMDAYAQKALYFAPLGMLVASLGSKLDQVDGVEHTVEFSKILPPDVPVASPTELITQMGQQLEQKSMNFKSVAHQVFWRNFLGFATELNAQIEYLQQNQSSNTSAAQQARFELIQRNLQELKGCFEAYTAIMPIYDTNDRDRQFMEMSWRITLKRNEFKSQCAPATNEPADAAIPSVLPVADGAGQPQPSAWSAFLLNFWNGVVNNFTSLRSSFFGGASGRPLSVPAPETPTVPARVPSEPPAAPVGSLDANRSLAGQSQSPPPQQQQQQKQ